MKHRDRVLMALHHERPDRCPMQISFTPEFADRLRQELLAAIARDGRVVEPAAFAGRPWPARLADWLALGAARVLVALTGNRFR